MKRAIVALGVLVIAAVALVMLPATRDAIQWHWTSQGPAKLTPKSEARLPATANEAVPPPQTQPDARPTAEQQAQRELDAWDDAQRSNTIRSLQRYIAAYPDGRFVQQAEARAAALRSDQTLYDRAVRNVSEASLHAFLADYPGHTREAEAKEILKEFREARDIVDLIQEERIEVEAKGAGISKVQVRMRRLAPQPLAVRIPVGAYFVSSNAAAQNMVTTAESKVWLRTDQSLTMAFDAACANRPKRIPAHGDTFTVKRSSHQMELAQLMPVLEKAKVDYKTKQAAVWIVTDNASYADLGVLVTSQSGVGGSRLITQKDAARAMRICQEAGIDVTKTAIWRDHPRILSGFEAGDLKTWLEEAVIASHAKEIEINPRNVQAYVNRGVVQHERGQHDRAIEDYTKAIEIDPKNKIAYNNRGFAHAAKGEYDPAIQDYDRAIALDPRYVSAFHKRGVAHEAKSDIVRALADFRHAFAIDGNRFSGDALKRLTPNP